MTIIYPKNRKEVSDRINTDVQNELPELTPSLRDSVINALIIGFAGRFFDIYEQQQQAQVQLFPDTATELEFERRWGLFKGIDIRPASASLGLITATGVNGTVIPEGTLFQNTANLDYEALNQDYTIAFVNLKVQSLTRIGDIATVKTDVDHNFGQGMAITITGADQLDYNITSIIAEVKSLREFTYTVANNPTSPATGTIFAGFSMVSIEVQSAGTGLIQNRTNGDQLTLKNPIAGIGENAFVQFEGITGGKDKETAEEYRARYLDAYANPISNSNDTDIERVLKAIPGITKVWTFDATPQPGKFETYFIRGNDNDIFPTNTEVTEAKEAILKIKPAPMRNVDVIVKSPIQVNVPFTFTALKPNSQALQTAIRESLKQLFIDETEVGEDLQEDAYRAAIFQTINPETGEFVQSFALSTPTTDIAIGPGQLPKLGTITFNTV